MTIKIFCNCVAVFLLLCLPASKLFAQDTVKLIFTYTGSDQVFTVPEGVTQIKVKAWGGGGAGGNYSYNDIGGAGGFTGGILAVEPKDNITIMVGGGGQPGAGKGAYGGGGAKDHGKGGRGGGRSAVITSIGELLTAGAGGGGGGVYLPEQTGGHAGGGVIAQPDNWLPYGGGAGTQITGGAGGENSFSPQANGMPGTLHQGGDAVRYDNGYNGSGGGGYFGGGSGTDAGDGAGGGGSAFVPAGGTTIAGNNNIPGNIDDMYYSDSVGYGGNAGRAGKPGRVIIFFAIQSVFYHDADNDGYGNFSDTVHAFTPPPGYVANSTDCNDDPANSGGKVYPGAPEICNGIDDNCDGQVDEGCIYRSATSGDWSSPATWESSTDSISWSPALAAPSAVDSFILIQPGHTITVSTPVSLDQTIVGGTLQVLTGAKLTIHDGAGVDLDIQNNGVLQLLSEDRYNVAIISATSVINISTGGKIEIGDGSVTVGDGYETFVTSLFNIWNDASVFEWNTPTNFVFAGKTYFPNALATTVPRLVITMATSPVGGAGSVTVNGLFTVNSNLSISGNGTKNFRNGISGNGSLTLNNITGTYNISSAFSEISGNLNLILFKDIHIKLGTTVTPGSTIIVSNAGTQGFNRESGDFVIAADARFEIGSTATITNTSSGNIIVNGTFATANDGGFTGAGSAIPSNENHVVLKPGSTVEYNAPGDQAVTSRDDYYNLTFSGSGTKKLSGGFNPSGTITISGLAVLNAKNYTVGNAGTNLTMKDSSRYITGGGNAKPDAQGNYNLAPGTTIEFALNSATTIRLGSPLAIKYADIVVSGTNVSNTSTISGIAFQAGSTFTVKNGAVFRLKNSNGFSGGDHTAVDSTNDPAVILEEGSTIEYYGSAQTITNQVPYGNLVLSSPGNKTASPGTLALTGNLSNMAGSIFLHNTGTVLFSNSTKSQRFASVDSGFTFYNLKNNNASDSGLLMESDAALEGMLHLGSSSKLSVGGNITLRSDSFTTASIAEVPPSAIIKYGAGRFIVERYITPKRAWRFLSVPDSSAQSIKEAWQEGAKSVADDPLPGYGIQITDKVTPDSQNGFDYYSVNGPTVKKFDSDNNAWIGISGTNVPITTTEGLMTFVRGDRTAAGLNASLSSTVLRTRGKLYTGAQSGIPVYPGKFASVGNPYASALDMRKIKTENVDSTFYVWDPKLTGSGFGAYQTFIFSGNEFYPTPGFGSYGDPSQAYNYIQSGQAFFVRNSGTVSGLVSLMETAKATTDSPQVNNTAVFRPVNNSRLQCIRTTLYRINGDSADVVDGVLSLFGDNYSNPPGKEDVTKVANFNENLAIKNGAQSFAVEKRHPVFKDDTIRLNLTGLRPVSYRFIFKASNFDPARVTAYLEDAYLKIRTPVNLEDTTVYNFSVTQDAGSLKPERFSVLFSEAAATLPVTFTSLRAYRQNSATPYESNTITLEWHVENETNIKEYLVEKSANGRQFSVAGILKAKGNGGTGMNYRWLDGNAFAGVNYYRIRSVTLNNELQYSDVVNVMPGKSTPRIVVGANPITGSTVNLQLINHPGGNFVAELLSSDGRVLSTGIINYAGGSGFKTLRINKTLSHGIYFLKIGQAGKDEFIFKIFN